MKLTYIKEHIIMFQVTGKWKILKYSKGRKGNKWYIQVQKSKQFWDVSTWALEKAMASHSSTVAWKNPMDGGAWQAAVHAVAKSQTWLSDFTFTFHFHALEKEMATQSSVLAWRIPGTGEPGGLPSMGSYRVGHDWSDLAATRAL